ncbi:cation/H(+) antiporter 2-like [Neltuma alba]|uniref:cation/H(+) antiporter 2-like n=1 Tax=Neltuma alba TaxID=207710 RepID=UPI0010A53F7B|nr:cation/H(+) antiporter 2-like [Prosopis alba]XP_028805556.1 cation/H(+) antiporter 2-like [Prosopis alba]
MDATHSMFCRQNDLINPLSSMGMQVSCILVISHFFNVVLKTFGQPGPIAQILAGVVLGPTALSHVKQIQEYFFLQSSTNYYEVVSFFCRIFITFLFGLEMNTQYMLLNLRLVSLVACGGAAVGGIFGLGVSFYLYRQLTNNAPLPYFCLIIMLIVSYTSSPLVIRLASEMRLIASNMGRIAVSSALITEMTCLLFFNLLVNWHTKSILGGLGCLVITGVLILINKHLALWLNKRHVNQKYLKAPQLLLILFLLVGNSMIIEIWGFNSIISCFLVGLMFPREGKTARTLIHKLGYSIYNFILPVYFGYLGFQCNLIALRNLNDVTNVAILILLSIASKLSGTLLACRYLQIPPSEGIFLGFILNTRGYADLLFFGAAAKGIIVKAYNVLLVAVVLNTIISGIIVASLTRADDKMFANQHTTLESQQVEDELRILACMYDPRQVSAVLALVLAINGSRTSPATIYSMHLIELVKKIKSNMLYHQKENAELSDDDDYGGNDVVEINEAIDNFTTQTKILIHQRKAVSAFPSLYEDVCNDAEDLHVTIILLPFHKHQRIDGKLESGKEGIRTTNQKVLRHAPCSVGVIVERGLSRVPGFSQLTASEGIQNVATLFFGGSDDREAIAWSIRMAQHSKINLTIIRFLLASMPQSETSTEESEDKEILMSLSGQETVNEIDNTFMVDFYNRFVASGQIGYVEKFVSNGAQTVQVFKEIGDMYSLFIVGKGGRGHCSLTIGMSDWEECPELGTVGDVLASSELAIHGSVLVVQQHRDVKKNLMND